MDEKMHQKMVYMLNWLLPIYIPNKYFEKLNLDSAN